MVRRHIAYPGTPPRERASLHCCSTRAGSVATFDGLTGIERREDRYGHLTRPVRRAFQSTQSAAEHPSRSLWAGFSALWGRISKSGDSVADDAVCCELVSIGLVGLMGIMRVSVDAMRRLINGVFAKMTFEPTY